MNIFLEAKKPQQIIAEHGFHPELVGNENQRFQRLVENDINSLVSKFLTDFDEDSRNATNNSTISLLSQKYTNERRLSVDELMNLLFIFKDVPKWAWTKYDGRI
jgi:hypothetical protein